MHIAQMRFVDSRYCRQVLRAATCCTDAEIDTNILFHEQPDQRRESPISWLTWGSRSTSTGGATGPPRVPPTLIGGRTGTVLISPSAGEGGGA